MIHVMPGNMGSGLDPARCMDIFRENLAWAADVAGAEGITLILEPCCSARFPQFLYGSGEQRGHGDLIIGSEGWILVSRESVRTHPEKLVRTVIGPNEIRVRSDDHKRNFLDAIRSGRQPISPIEAAVRGESMCQIGDIAIRLKRKLHWDPDKEIFPDDPAANRRLSRPMRSPWRL